MNIDGIKLQHKTISKNGYFIDKSKLSDEQIKNLRKELDVTPKELDFGEDTKNIKVYYENETLICIPRFYGIKKFGKHLKTSGLKPQKIEIKFNGEPREIQKPVIDKAVKTLKTVGGGMLKLYCGFGKTVLALIIASILKVKTLIIVHKSSLQTQWYDRIKMFTDAKVGIIRQNKIDVEDKDIVVGMLQSISMKDYDKSIFKDFGLVICDECHHFSSRVFSQALFKVGAKYMLGLSATPERKNGTTKILHWYMGNMICDIERQGDKRVQIKFINSFYDDKKLYVEKRRWINRNVGVKANMPIMINNIVKIKKRNQFIIDCISKLMVQDERKILVLSDRINHLENMNNELKKLIKQKEINEELEVNEITTSLYIGKMKSYELDDAQKADIIFASYPVASEGLDIPDLNTLVLSTPKSDVIQCVGRILRKQLKDGDTLPTVIDIADQFSMFSRHGQKRLDYYKKKKYTIEEYNCIDGKIVSNIDFIKKTSDESYIQMCLEDASEEDFKIETLDNILQSEL